MKTIILKNNRGEEKRLTVKHNGHYFFVIRREATNAVTYLMRKEGYKIVSLTDESGRKVDLIATSVATAQVRYTTEDED